MSVQTIVPAALQPISSQFGFAPAVLVGDLILVSGQLGLDPDLTMPESPERQIDNIFRWIALILDEAGASVSDLASLTSYHVGDLASQMPLFIASRGRVLQDACVAWTAVGVAQLAAPGALIEVSAVARRPPP